MGKMSHLGKMCLLCLKDVNLEVEDNDGGHPTGRRATRLSASKEKGREIQPLTLFQLVQHPKFVGSAAHENIIQGHEGEGTCALCHKCAALAEDVAAVGGQIIALQAILGEMVGIIRGRIVESDGKRRSKGLAQQDEGLDGLLAIRQSLLILSDDEACDISQGHAEVKVKIEEEDDYDGLERDNFMDVNQSHPDEDEFTMQEHGDEGEEDSDCSFVINPQTTRKNKRKVSKRKISVNNQAPRKRGLPKKESAVVTKGSSHETTEKASTLSSCEIDGTSECGPLEMEDDEGAKKKVNNDGKSCTLGSFKCDSCTRSYASQALLSNHIAYLHKYSCDMCKQRFRTQQAMESHQKEKHHRTCRPFQCLVCQRTFRRPSRLQIHMMVKHETKDKPFVCTKCDKRFTLELNLEQHLKLHEVETERPLVCEVCDARFRDTKRLEQHALIHTKRFTCEFCNQIFLTNDNLKRHVRTHTGEKPFQCDHCKERFIDKPAKQYHTDKVHSTPDQHHLCTICGKTFFSMSTLRSHLNRHEGKIYQYKWKCTICEETFVNTAALQRHNVVNHGHDPFVCDKCGMQFNAKPSLTRHKMVHGGDKRHKCEICDARFLIKGKLKDHIRTHTMERPFVCHHCGKAFKQNTHLKLHVKTMHTADYVVPTPFLCSHCGKAYPRKGFLDDHIRQAHTGERPFVCEVCNQGFAIKAALTQHMKSHGINISREKGPRIPRSKRDFSSDRSNQILHLQ